MAVTVFTWDMFKFTKDFGVGHAAMHVRGEHGDIYVSFWPSAHRIDKAIYSTGLVHFMRGDKEEDGMPGWVSKPLDGLDEKKIVDYWSNFDPNHNLDYRGGESANVTKANPGGQAYNILLKQCSTTVVMALLSGADLATKLKMMGWLSVNAGSNFDFGGFKGLRIPGIRIPTITPADVREMVESVW